jgi:hypothetical protein
MRLECQNAALSPQIPQLNRYNTVISMLYNRLLLPAFHGHRALSPFPTRFFGDEVGWKQLYGLGVCRIIHQHCKTMPNAMRQHCQAMLLRMRQKSDTYL